MTLVLVAVLVVTGVVLTVAYRPAPDGPALVRTSHRFASALLLPASWVLLASLVLDRSWARRRGGLRPWLAPALLVLAVPAAAFTGFLLPWERIVSAVGAVPPDLAGVEPAFDVAVAAVTFGGAPVSRSTFQRYVLAHVALGAVVVLAAVAVGRTTGPGRTAASPPVGGDQG